MNKCNTCRYWNSRDVGANDEHGRRITMGECDNKKCASYMASQNPDDAAPYAETIADLSFRTGPEFGCIHWAEKK